MMRRLILACALIVVAHPALASAGNLEVANEAYERGEWQLAEEHYRGLVALGIEHPDLFYNLANTHFKQGEVGRASYYYRRTLALEPGAADARRNLDLLDKAQRRRGAILVPGEAVRPWWHGLGELVGARLAELVLLGSSVAFFLALALMRRAGQGFRRAFLRVAVAVAIVLGVASGGLRAARALLDARSSIGVVLEDRSPLREAPRADSPRRAELWGGQELSRLREQRGWTLVRLPNGVEGWVDSTSVGHL